MQIWNTRSRDTKHSLDWEETVKVASSLHHHNLRLHKEIHRLICRYRVAGLDCHCIQTEIAGRPTSMSVRCDRLWQSELTGISDRSRCCWKSKSVIEKEAHQLTSAEDEDPLYLNWPLGPIVREPNASSRSSVSSFSAFCELGVLVNWSLPMTGLTLPLPWSRGCGDEEMWPCASRSAFSRTRALAWRRLTLSWRSSFLTLSWLEGN